MRNKGFTLIETLIALVITVAAGLLLSSAWSGNFMRVRKTTLNNNVAQLLERKIVELEAKYTGKAITEIKEEEGNFGDDFPQYRWSFSAQPFEMPDLTPILMKGNDSTDQMLITMMGKMREIVNKSIIEATVTVYVQAAGKEVPYSVTTYFVDYEAANDVGIGP
jgi:prepilin-type N-terminal cleavage/methylation domain-containing protein